MGVIRMKKHFVISVATLLASLDASAAVPKKVNPFEGGERLVYTRVVEAYRKSDLNSVIQNRNLLEKNYPNSVHLDNAYYLTGMLQFQDNRVGEAVKSFGTVRSRFPQSNKRPAALFGLAMSYRKLGLQSLANNIMNEISREYPGSPESQRAMMQLQIDKKGSLKR
jgi:TolA-binding protein